MSDIIAAVSTGRVVSAIGIVRLSGEGCIPLAFDVFTPRGQATAKTVEDRKLILGALHDHQGRIIDEAMLTVSRAPHSYTGEDTAEFHCHGSPAVLSAALEALFAKGARQAGPGEFTKRAFLNGRMDLTQAEAVIDLIEAESAEAAVYDRLTDVLAHFHAELDYPDEDIDPLVLSEVEAAMAHCAGKLREILATYGRGQVLRRGIRAVILGKPNAGKSSLLNALAGFDRVIVTDIAGTTRDTVEETVKVGRHLLRLMDTAGIRDTSDEIERLGVARAEAAAREADLAIYVCDSAAELTDEDFRAQEAAQEAPAAIAILNKQDLPQVVAPSDLPFEWIVPLSAKTGAGIEQLEDALDAIFEDDIPCDGSILTNTRQAGACARALEALERCRQGLAAAIPPDAALTDVEEALLALGEITGKSMREEVVGKIFSRFCVGK